MRPPSRPTSQPRARRHRHRGSKDLLGGPSGSFGSVLGAGTKSHDKPVRLLSTYSILVAHTGTDRGVRLGRAEAASRTKSPATSNRRVAAPWPISTGRRALRCEEGCQAPPDLGGRGSSHTAGRERGRPFVASPPVVPAARCPFMFLLGRFGACFGPRMAGVIRDLVPRAGAGGASQGGVRGTSRMAGRGPSVRGHQVLLAVALSGSASRLSDVPSRLAHRRPRSCARRAATRARDSSRGGGSAGAPMS